MMNTSLPGVLPSYELDILMTKELKVPVTLDIEYSQPQVMF